MCLPWLTGRLLGYSLGEGALLYPVDVMGYQQKDRRPGTFPRTTILLDEAHLNELRPLCKVCPVTSSIRLSSPV